MTKFLWEKLSIDDGKRVNATKKVENHPSNGLELLS